MNKRISYKRSVIVILIAAVTAAVVLAFLDYRELSVALHSIDPWYIPFIFFIMPMNFVTRFFKFDFYLRTLGYCSIAKKDEIIVLVSSFVMVITPAKLGEMLLKGYMLQRKYPLMMTEIMAMTIAERITDGFAMVALAVLGLSFLRSSYGLLPIVIVCAVMVGIVLVVQSKTLCHALLRILERIPFLKKYSDGFMVFYESAYQIFRFKPLLIATAWGVVAWLCETAVMLLSVKAFGGSVTFAQALFVVSFSGIAGAVSLMPGGLLVADGTIMGLLVWMGQSISVSGAAMLVSRFSTMWLGVCMGAVALYFAKKNGLWGATMQV